MFNKIPNHILKDLREHRGLEPEDSSADDIINTYSKEEVLDKYLEWNGIIGYTDVIVEIMSLS